MAKKKTVPCCSCCNVPLDLTDVHYPTGNVAEPYCESCADDAVESNRPVKENEWKCGICKAIFPKAKVAEIQEHFLAHYKGMFQ